MHEQALPKEKKRRLMARKRAEVFETMIKYLGREERLRSFDLK